MASSANVIREYLVSLGYKVDVAQQRRFDLSLLKTDAGASGLLKTLLGVATAAQAAMVVWARSMERMYYSSQRAESSVGSLKAMEFAARNVGVSGETMTSAIEGMARAMRANPGLAGLLKSLGIRSEGRGRAEVMMDLLEKLRGMPQYIGQQYAQMFGMDPDTLFMLTQNLDKFKEAAELQKQVYAEFGVDADQAGKSAHEYANRLREIEERLAAIKDRVAIEFLPDFKKLSDGVNEALKSLGHWSTGQGKNLATTVREATPSGTPGSAAMTLFEKAGEYFGYRLRGGGPEGPSTPAQRRSSGTVGADLSAVQGDTESLFNMLETKFGLPKGILDRLWAQESGRGKHLLSDKGAKGDFQFMDATAQQYGVDPWDLSSSAQGAARMLADLLRKYGGDLMKALAGYNWGQGNLDKFGLGAMPNETQGFVKGVGGPYIEFNQKTDIHVEGGADPAATGRAVAREQNGVGNEVVRNLKAAVQ